jgi:chromosomal replication initiator protein
MTDPDRQIWAGMLAHLRGHEPGVCRQWFEEIEPLGIASGVMRLRAHSQVHRDYLQRQCLDHFNSAAQAVSERLISVQFYGPDEDPSADRGRTIIIEPKERSDARPRVPGHNEPFNPGTVDGVPEDRVPGRASWASSGRPMSPESSRWRDTAYSSLVLNPDYVFENFIVGPENRLAHAASLAIAANPGNVYNPFFVHGDVGLGKTHLLQAICLRIKQTNPDARIFYTSCERFITAYVDAVQAGEMSEFRHTFRDVDVLVIDDIHFLAKRDRSQEEFFHTFNSLYQVHKQIILSSDAPPEDIPDLEDRLVSRFKWGLVANVAPPCYETRVAILKNKARLRGMDLPDDAACHIAAKIDTNIRELEGVVVKLQALSMIEKRPGDLAMARAALGEEPGRTERQIQIQSIIDAVTDFFGVKVTDLQSKRRHRSVALPRQVCMFLARKHTRHSLEEIGGYFGGRDHTTVMHAIKTVENRIELEADFVRIMQTLETALKTPPTA